MGVGAAILASAGISAVGNAVAGSKAAKAAKSTGDQASATQLEMYNRTRADLAPFSSTGASAMSQLAAIFGFGPGGTGQPSSSAAMSQLENFPGYKFGMDQGVQALDRSAASRGLLLSGAQLQDVTKFGQGYAQQQAWQPYVSGLQWAANLGENAAAGTGQLGATAASGAASAQLQSGLAAGSAQGNAIAGITNGLNSSLQQYALNNSAGYVQPNASQLTAAGFTNTGPLPGDPPY